MADKDLLQIDVSELVLGLTVKLPLSWKDNPFFLKKIKLEKLAEIELIKSLNITFVYVLAGHELLENRDEHEDVEQEPEIEQEVTHDYQPEAKKAMRLGQQRFLKCINDSRAVFGKVVTDPEGAVREATILAENLYEHLCESDEPSLTLVATGDLEASVTMHGISTSVLAMLIAHALNLPKIDVREIAMGSILHDIGKLKVPEAIRRKRGDLTTQESNFLKMHPNFGYEMLERSGVFSAVALDIVLHHHELIDGSGYPHKLTEKEIPITTQIVALANDYETLLDQYLSPQLTLGILFKTKSGKHAEKLISVLVKVLGIYPPGTLVNLSDGSVGKVMMTSKEVRQPHVWACQPDGANPSLRFLIDEDVTITDVIKLDALSQKAVQILKAENPISFYFNSLNH